MSHGVMKKVKAEGRGEVFESVDAIIAELRRVSAERDALAAELEARLRASSLVRPDASS